MIWGGNYQFQAFPLYDGHGRTADLIINIRHIHDKLHVIAHIVPQDTTQNIRGDIIPSVPKMPRIVHSGPTAIPGDLLPSRVNRHELNLFPTERIVYAEVASGPSCRGHGASDQASAATQKGSLCGGGSSATQFSQEVVHQWSG